MPDDGFHRARLRKQMTCARNDLQRLGTGQAKESLLIELDNAMIGAANDQQCRGMNPIEVSSRKIGAARAEC
jgi:hypothetical protein